MQIILGKWSNPADRKARQTTELAVHTTRMRIQTPREATHLHYWSPRGSLDGGITFPLRYRGLLNTCSPSVRSLILPFASGWE